MENLHPNDKGAEAVLHLQSNSSVSIAYHTLFGPHDDLILLEVDEKLLPEVLNQRVTVKGLPDEDAVFCTQSKTYGIKFVGNSNSVFLIPPSDQPEISQNLQNCDEKDNNSKVIASVLKVVSGNMELVEVAPRIDKLKLLLSENPYSLNEEWEMEESGRCRDGLYTWNDLINKVQASDDELRIGLQALSAVKTNGYWRIVDERYMDSLLQMILHNSVLNDWPLGALNENEVITMLESDGFPHKLVQHCLQVYGCKVENSDGGKSYLWRLDEKQLCVHFARMILRKGKIRMENFMAEWMHKIPEGMQACFDMLEGEVLTERIGVETWVRGFRVSSLPSNPAERFSILFRERPKWVWKDLQPYVRDLNVPGLSSEGLLLKYTRRTQPDLSAEPVFSAR